MMATRAAYANGDRSLGRLFSDLSTDVLTLLRQEIDLAKTEVAEKASHLGVMAKTLAIGGALAFFGALALLAALILGVTSLFSQFMSPGVAVWLGPLVVGLVLAGIGYISIRKALDANETLVPHETTESLQENKEWLKAKIA